MLAAGLTLHLLPWPRSSLPYSELLGYLEASAYRLSILANAPFTDLHGKCYHDDPRLPSYACFATNTLYRPSGLLAAYRPCASDGATMDGGLAPLGLHCGMQPVTTFIYAETTCSRHGPRLSSFLPPMGTVPAAIASLRPLLLRFWTLVNWWGSWRPHIPPPLVS
ncbi:hypothetical protein LZ30DRAFT_95390 [Colletotrichum cereale]|nr:hypothetical protein LZ30DRAFT_95390 [Colletotrichum cereale]